MLGWLSHDLDDALAADAYCLDAWERGWQAEDGAICAWAMDAQASIAMYNHRAAVARTPLSRASHHRVKRLETLSSLALLPRGDVWTTGLLLISAAVSAATIQYLDGRFFLRDGLRMTHSLLSALALAVVIARSSVWLGLIATLPVLVMGTTGTCCAGG